MDDKYTLSDEQVNEILEYVKNNRHSDEWLEENSRFGYYPDEIPEPEDSE